MAMLGQGVLALWMDVEPSARAECDEWYLREHIPDRVRVPGFHRARRYHAAGHSPGYLALYEADTLETMLEPGYMSLLDRISDQSRRMRAAFGNVVRGTFRVSATSGSGQGGVAVSIRFAPGPREAAAAVRDWVRSEFIPESETGHGLVGVSLLEADPEVRARMDRVRATGSSDASADWVLLVEATRPTDLDRVRERWLDPHLSRLRATVQQCTTYRLLYTVDARDFS